MQKTKKNGEMKIPTDCIPPSLNPAGKQFIIRYTSLTAAMPQASGASLANLWHSMLMGGLGRRGYDLRFVQKMDSDYLKVTESIENPNSLAKDAANEMRHILRNSNILTIMRLLRD